MEPKKTKKSLWLFFDRILSHDLGKQALILVGLLLLIYVVALGMLHLSGSEWQKYCDTYKISYWALPFYLLIDSNTFAYMVIFNEKGPFISRLTIIIACICFILGVIIFTGMIISVMTNMISRRVENHKNGLIHYLKSGHHVILGYDDMVPSIIDDIFTRDRNTYVLLMTSIEAFKTRERLRKSVANKYMDRIIINYGHRITAECYKEIKLERAKEIFIAGQRSLPAHDAINIECVDSICEYLNELKSHDKLKNVPERITCVFEDLDTYAAFKTADIFEEVRKLNIEFIPYNFYAGWARQVFVQGQYKDNSGEYISYPTVYGNGITPQDQKFVHLVFVGTTNFAVAFAQEAAHVLHFPNFVQNTALKTRITFIEINADKEKPLFVTRNRHFFEVQHLLYSDMSDDSTDVTVHTEKPLVFNEKDGDFLDIEYEFIKGNVFSTKIQDMLRKWATSGDQYLSIFLTLADQRENFIMGMNMPDDIYAQEIPIFIRQDRSDNFVTNLRKVGEQEFNYSWVENGKIETKKRSGRYACIYPFGMNDMSYCSDEELMRRAKLVNFLYSKFHNLKPGDWPKLEEEIKEKSSDDYMDEANKAWQQLTVAHKWSNLYCAYNFPGKLATLRQMRGLASDNTSKDTNDLSNDELNILTQVEHNRWNVEKLLMGFRKPSKKEDHYEYAQESNHQEIREKLSENKKLFIHHDIRPYDQLKDVKELERLICKFIPWIIKKDQPNHEQ